MRSCSLDMLARRTHTGPLSVRCSRRENPPHWGISGQENAPPGKRCRLRHYPILGLVVLLFVAHPASADPPASRGAALASACAVCHGPGGRSRGAIPGLDGLSPESLRQAMYDFRAGKRPATVMRYIAAGLAPADIEAVVTHFGQEGES